MKNLKLNFLLEAVSGKLLQGSNLIEISGVSIDSRSIDENEVFFAIIGEKFDGHDFIKDAIANGAVAVVVDRKINEVTEDIAIILVDDTSAALQDLAKNYRLKLDGLTVIGITGSAGKTSTKDMLASVMSMRKKTKKTKGNLNNYYGLPLTLLDFEGDEDIAVLEMGMSDLGEIELLTDIAQPQIGVITNVGEAHLETLGSVENVAKAKSELISALPKDGLAILNYDNNYVRAMKEVYKGEKIIYYGLSREADIYADNIKTRMDGSIEFSVNYQEEVNDILLNRTGRHNVYNALAVIAVARHYNLTYQEIQKGFDKIDYSALRWDIKETSQGIKVINDTYNANPLSMRAAIEAVKDMDANNTILALGSMLELGEKEEISHRELGQFVASKNIDYLVTIGDIATGISNAAIESGMDDNRVINFNNKKDAAAYLEKISKKNDLILVKGSRGNKLENIVTKLLS
ncbi:UDP-N-acetylmuramoyl-tripeptide--D-alanyl-D-alanine ligase [Natronospora cellulosivora (SeqCode)]